VGFKYFNLFESVTITNRRTNETSYTTSFIPWRLLQKFPKSENRRGILKGLGFSDIDALHIALAEKANVHYFVTCDDDIVKLYKKNENAIRVKIASLIELIGLEE